MLLNLLGFELKIQIRQVGFWIAFAALLALGILFSSTESFSAGSAKVKANGAIPIASLFSVLSLGAIFFSAVYVVTGVMRDTTHKAVEVIHATPVKTPAMVISRMLGVWIATMLTLSALALGAMMGPFMPWAEAEVFKDFNLLHYLQPFVLFCVINAFLVSAVYTLIAVTTRKPAIVYTSAVGLIVIYLVSSALIGEDPAKWLGAVADPFGGASLYLETRFWPAAEQNNRMAPVTGWIGINRLYAIAIGLALFAAAFVLSTRGIATRRTAKRGDMTPAPAAPRRIAPVAPALGTGFTLSAIWTRLRFEYLSTVRSTAFIILLGLAVGLFAIVLLITLAMGQTTTLPTSTFMTQVALGSLFLPLMIIAVFFGSDIMWRDRTAKMHGIVDATPVRDVSMLFAKWGALALVLLTVVLVMLVAGMLTQAVLGAGRTDVVPSTFLSIGVVNFYLGFFFFGMLAMVIQSFMPGRIIGMLVAAGAIIFLQFFASNLPFYHPLMNFGSVNAGAYSEMGGFNGTQGFWWEFGYWMGLILLLGALSVWVWRRGFQIGFGDRLRRVSRRLSAPSLAAAALGIALFAGLGVVGLNDYQARDYENAKQRRASTAEFERFVSERVDDQPPRITSVSVEGDIFPSSRTATFRGRYTIDNPFSEPLTRTTAFSRVGVDNIEQLEIEGATVVRGTDFADRLREDYDVLDIAFEPPLQPGESREVEFVTSFDAPSLTESAAIQFNGTFVNNSEALIIFGNLANGFLQNPDARRREGLGERMQWPDRDDADARRYHLLTSFSGLADYVDFDATLCTSESQIPVAPGKFRGETVEDGRRCRRYASINPILNFFAFVSADYDVARDVWEGDNGQTVELEIYHHPTHDYNIDTMMAASKVALDTFTEEFSPYQYAQLRIMEFPYGAFAQAFAGTVPFAENMGFVQDPGNEDDPERVDWASYVTMHEIGHQWFAHQVIGAYAKGSNLLSEGLTENATMLAYERLYDRAKARRVHEDRTTQQYLMQRTMDPDKEPVLAKAEGQGYLNYNKTSWVMWGMRGVIGDAPVKRATQSFLRDHHADNGAPYPTTLELLELFREEIDAEYHPLIEDYWNNITFWDLSFADDPTVTDIGNGRFEVTVPVALDKLYASSEDGAETSVTEIDGASLESWVVVAAYTEDPSETLGINPAAQVTARIDEAEATVTLVVDGEPTHVVLDPHRYLVERNVGDNTSTLETASLGASGAN